MLIGTRGSELARRQTQEVLNQLQAAHLGVCFEVTTVVTRGDTNAEEPIARLGLGAFVKELEKAILRREIDAAVHSLKDVPTEQTPGLTIAAVTKREDPRDALINRWGLPLDRLPAGARIGTGSPRRAAQLRHLRPDIEIVAIRGNVPTRLEKARGREFDGVVVALAGLRRLGRESEAAQVFDADVMVPAPGQGALAIQTREKDEEVKAMARTIQDGATAAAVQAERALLVSLGGGCQAAFGAYAAVAGETVRLSGVLASEAGSPLFKVAATGSIRDPEAIGREAYRKLVAMGAIRLLGVSGAAR